MCANSDDQRQRFAELEQRLDELEAENEQLREQLEGGNVSRRSVLGALAGAGGVAMLGSGAMSQQASAATWSDGDGDNLLETGSEGIDVGEVKTDEINSVTQINKDDTEADIQQKIDNAGSYHVIEFGEGTWDISNGLDISYDHIVLRGDRESVLQVADGANLSGAVVSGTGNNITIDGLRFYGNSGGQSDPSASAISLDGSYLTVRNCQVQDFWVSQIENGYGITLQSGGHTHVHDNRIRNVGRDFVEIQPLGTSPAGSDVVADNVMARTMESPVTIDLGTADTYQAYGVYAETPGATIRNNVIDWSGAPKNDKARLFSVLPRGNYTSVVGNYMKDAIGEQIYASASDEYVLVAANEIHGAREDPLNESISYSLLGPNSAFVSNYVTEHKDYGFVAGGKNTLVANNVFENNVNDVLINEPNATITGNQFHETASDAITIDAKRTLVSNNMLSSTDAKDAGGHAMRVRTDAGQAFVTSNWIDYYYGIYGYDSAEMWVSNNMFETADSYETLDFSGNSTINRRDNWSL